MVNWISTDDSLPIESQGLYRSKAVLIYCPESKCIFSAYYDYEEKVWKHFAAHSTTICELVTHWAFLPRPPVAD